MDEKPPRDIARASDFICSGNPSSYVPKSYRLVEIGQTCIELMRGIGRYL